MSHMSSMPIVLAPVLGAANGGWRDRSSGVEGSLDRAEEQATRSQACNLTCLLLHIADRASAVVGRPGKRSFVLLQSD